ncbi:MAG: MaoC/PaaZ C-terminal domain-containing protein [Aigarchaeota archaeon]|nr:MaoC/PaaZ C-terminal domain-containing protein [Aigarchaeota archaeon]MDW8092861.1 MaoC/PaaZ C-terminal domain-containing protein [Nitrososphaerota archaeon]
MYFEDLEEGSILRSRPRFITPTDLDLFTSLTWANNPLFLSDDAARAAGMRARIAPGALLVSIAIGLLYQTGVFDHIRAMTELHANFLNPVSPGEVVKVEGEVVSKRVISEATGEVTFKVQLKNLSTNKDSISMSMKLIHLRRK